MKLITWFKNNYFLVAVLVIASILRFYHFDYQSVWVDEVHTINEANPSLSLAGLYNEILRADPHPPLYFILMHYVFMVFGYTAQVLRLFSVVLGIVGVGALYVLANELFNKKTALYAALLLSINSFHLAYSQEGRMYALLFVFTIFAFYFLIRFIKKPGIKSGLVYALFSAAMIYCHFFGLFILISQYILLFYFIIKPYKVKGTKFFLYSFVSGLTTLILYIPVLGILQRAGERTTIWIPMPEIDAYTQIFKDFFGQAEIVLFFVVLLVLAYFFNIFRERESKQFRLDPAIEKRVFAFFVLMIWISVSLFIPLVRTYTSLPMIINRYFIIIIPALLMIVSSGLYAIRNEIVRAVILMIIVVFSLTDLIVVKKYYKTVTKTQIREVTNFIIDNNSKQEPVVAELAWYFPFFLNNDRVKTSIVEKPLESHIAEMMQDSTKIKPFWYVHIHTHFADLTLPAKEFLEKHFVIAHNKDAFNSWTNHYTLISDALQEVDLSGVKTFDGRNGDNYRYYIDIFDTTQARIRAEGYAYFENQDANDSNIELVLKGDQKSYAIQTLMVRRDDLSAYFKSNYDLSNSGFKTNMMSGKLPPGKYQLGIILKSKVANKQGLVLTDYFYIKN